MNIVIFGLGYSSQAFLNRERSRFDAVTATVRSREKAAACGEPGLAIELFPGDEDAIARALPEADAILVSIPPDQDGDPVLRHFGDAIAASSGIRWIGYLSTIGVYGDHDGAWIDETTQPHPESRRSRWRLAAEEVWLALGRQTGRPVQIFRLAGIYGPGRNAFDKLRDGTARRIIKQGQIFNRIHVDDIAAVLAASLDRPRAGAIYNVTDDEPCPPQDVIAHAAQLVGLEPPPEVAFADVEMSPMAASFWGESKRVRNRLLHDELGLDLVYPTYREGLAALAPSRSPGHAG